MKRLAWFVCGLTVAIAVARVVLAVTDPESSSAASGSQVPGGGVPMAAFEALVLTALGVIGAVVASRQPRNPIGWMLCAIPFFIGVLILGVHVFWSLALGQSEPSDVAKLVVWLTSWIWIPGVMPALTLFPLLFPTGRPLTPRWRPVVWIAIATFPVVFVSTAFAPGRLGEYPVENPFGADGAWQGAVEAVGILGWVLMVGTVIAGPASLVLRFRRSRGVERQQLKWVTAAAALFLAIFILPFDNFLTEDASFALLLLVLLIVACAVAIAMLRHRLYDIDVVIRRTLVYAGLTATLGATYLGLVLLAGLAVGESDVAIAASTLAVATLFRPARVRIQAAVDHRFYRHRYDAARTLETFSGRLRDELDLEALGADLRAVVHETVAPAHVSLWLRRNDFRTEGP